jgi:hypothetical protein
MQDFLFKIKTATRRYLVGLFKISRPTSFPYITGDGFRSLAQHILDETSGFDPAKVEKNDIVFVRSDFLRDFFSKKHKLIKHEYILISHNYDATITEEYSKYIDDKIIHWFTQNLSFSHHKVTAIPIGITNYYYNYLGRGNISYIIENARNAKVMEKKNKMSYGFFLYCNPERPLIKKMLDTLSYAESIDENRQFEYLKKMANFKFTESPEGNGIDCHRTWEALYLKTVPLVKRSYLTESFKNIGMPIVLVDKWDELTGYDDQKLDQIYKSFEFDDRNTPIYMKYWIDEILSKRI